MDFRFTLEQEQFRESARRFAEKHLAAGARERAHSSDYPWDVSKLMATQGLLGITIAEADGGQGGALIDAVIAIEAVASVCPRSADVVQAGNFGPIRVLAEYGTPGQKQKYLKRLLSGGSVISVGMTEPEAGSAVTDLQTTATPEGDGYRVNGSKVFTTHAPHAEVILTYVRYGPGVSGIGSVLVDTKAKGVRFGQRSKFMSGEEWAQIFRERLRSRRHGGSERRRIQEADRGVQRRADRQRRPLARAGALRVRACATVGDAAQAVRAPLVRVPGAAVEVRRDENEARRRPAPALPRRGERRPRFPLGGGGRDRQGILQPGRVRRRERVAAGDGRPRLHAGGAGRVLPAALPRLDDRRRLDRDPQEPHRGSRVRAQLH